MLRPFAIALLAASFVMPAFSTPSRAEDARQTVETLESQLLQADDSSRPALLEQLRRAYAAAATEAEDAGLTAEAQVYRTNLSILEQRLGPPPEPKNKPPESPPPALPAPEETAPEAVQPPKDKEKPAADEPPPEDPKVGLASLPAPSEPQPQPKPAEPDPTVLVEQADELYRAEKYTEAGAIYSKMAESGQLPENRRNAWAYCRRFEVVKRINGQPRSDGEWAEIAAEIAAIRRLSPSVWWFDVYLQDLVRERSGQTAKTAPKSNQVVLRGAQPEENSLALPRPSAPRKPAETTPPSPAPSASGPMSATGMPAGASEKAPKKTSEPAPPPFHDPDLSRWQVETTANFRIYHANPELAKEVARVAEAAREEQVRRWTGQPPRGTWYPVCEIYLYPNAEIFSQRTEQPEDSPGFSTSGLMAGKVTARRINLRADHDKLTEAVLPHEVTHIVLAELFADQQIPRWADEGMAVLAEPSEEQRVRAQDLAKPLGGGRIFGVEQLLVMDYPDGQFWPLYYAQSISLTRFLVETSSPVRFVEFVKDAQRHGYDAALRRHYQINGLADLQSRWESYARSSLEVHTASNGSEPTERE